MILSWASSPHLIFDFLGCSCNIAAQWRRICWIWLTMTLLRTRGDGHSCALHHAQQTDQAVKWYSWCSDQTDQGGGEVIYLFITFFMTTKNWFLLSLYCLVIQHAVYHLRKREEKQTNNKTTNIKYQNTDRNLMPTIINMTALSAKTAKIHGPPPRATL